MVDPPQQLPDKRKRENQPSPRPTKRQTFWVEIPSRPKRKGILSTPVKHEPSTPEDAIVLDTVPRVKEEPDQEMVNALAVIRNVSWGLNTLLRISRSNYRLTFAIFCRKT